VLVIIGDLYALQRVPYIRQYYEEKQKYLFITDKSQMPVGEDGQTPLLHNLDVTIEGIKVLQKYNLSVYEYWNAYMEAPTTEPIGDYINYKEGRWDDGWVEPNMLFVIDGTNVKKIVINYYAPTKQKLTISVGDNSPSYKIELKSGSNAFEIPCAQSGGLTVKISSDYVQKMDAPDNRKASFILSSVKLVR